MSGLTTVRSYSQSVADLLESEMKRHGTSLLLSKPELPYDAFASVLPADHRRFYESLEPMVETEDVIAVHAGVGIEEGLLADQTEADLVWGEKGWWYRNNDEKRIVYGHWNNAVISEDGIEPNVVGRTYGIDCIAAGVLVAIRFPDLQVWKPQEETA